MPRYKVWAEIERVGDDGDCVSVTNGDCAEDAEDGTPGEFAEPVPIGTFDTLEEAVAFAEGMEDE